MTRWLTRIAVFVLWALVGSAVLAPILASDRPLAIEAVDFGAYGTARRELQLPVRSLIQLTEAGADAYAARPSPSGERPSYAAALGAECTAVRLRTSTMRRFLPPGADTLLVKLENHLHALTVRAEAGDAEGAAAEARDALAAARLAEASLVAARGERPDPRSIELAPTVVYPLPASLSGLDVALIALFLGLTAVLLAPRLAARSAPWWLALAVCTGVAYQQLRPEAPPRDWKQATEAGELEVQRSILPVIYMGYGESHLEEALRAPTWTKAGKLDADGRRTGGAPGAAERPESASHPVQVRAGEPERNSWWRHPLGTDGLGRDLFARVLHGGRISLLVGLISALLTLSIGVVVGACAGFFGGRVDWLGSRLIEVFQCFPTFFLVVTAVALIPEQRAHPLVTVVAVIALVNWTGVARLVRAEFLRARELDYVASAKSLGLGPARVVFGHVLPNVLGPVLVAGAFAVAAGVLIESGVSFLGFGVKHPVPSWGSLLSESRSLEHWWLQLFPGLMIFAAVLSTHVLGEALRERLDPKRVRRIGSGGALVR